ncbi:MAG: cell division protein ZapA [Clostridiales bacterium]|nr:cell division protein ZapA [Clostridiales bacterium]
MDNNKVRVKIYGQEYTVAGEESRERIIKVADHVDLRMREVEKAVKSGQMSAIAVLSALNIADEYFSSAEAASELKKMNAQLEKDVAHYVQMWEEAKRSFLQYKEDAQAVTRKKETLKATLNEREQEVAELKIQLDEAEMKAKKEVEAEIEKLQDKLREMESNYFDLQMENVQMKSELERLKRIMVKQ